MFYKKQFLNPNKHPLMLDDYPWITSDIAIDEEFIEISQEDLDILLATDLTDYHNAIALDTLKEKLEKKRVFGVELASYLCIEVGARNVTLISQGASAAIIVQVLSSFASTKMLLETGAIETAKGAIMQMMAGFSDYADIMQDAIDKIDLKLSELQ